MADFEIIRQPTAKWEFDNPTLLENQIGVCSDMRNGVETDTGYTKLGNGIDDWFTLPNFLSWGNITGNPSDQADLVAIYETPNIKRYRASVTQTSTNAPVATVLENTLGGTLVWSYENVGVYKSTLAGVFTANKTLVRGSTGSATDAFIAGYRGDANFVWWETRNNAGTYTNSLLAESFIEILIYP